MAERRTAGLAAAALLVLLVGGCASGQQQINEEDTVDITTATQELQDELAAVQEQFGGEWEVEDPGAPLSCPDRDGSASKATRYGVPSEASASVYDTAKARWADEGYAIEERTDPDGVQRLFATKEDGALRQIALGANVIMLQASTPCLPVED